MTEHRMGWRLAAPTAALSLIAWVANADPPSKVEAEQAPHAKPMLPELTVRAQRDALQRSVKTFVSTAIREPFDESLVRWNSPICFLVVGLPQEGNQFVRARLADLAAAAGAHPAPQPCEANFAVLVTDKPEAVLRAWYKRDLHLFGDAIEYRINEWLKTPRDVRVWYNTKTESSGGLPYAIAGAGAIGLLPPDSRLTVDNFVEDTRLAFDFVRDFSSVIVAIDSDRTEGTNLKELADYAAMVGLAEIQTNTDFSDVPTILRLFSNSEEAKPTGLTDWDAALLKGLYNTSQENTFQRAAIIQNVVHDIAP